jgi:hypothetical protein
LFTESEDDSDADVDAPKKVTSEFLKKKISEKKAAKLVSTTYLNRIR